MSSLTNAGKRGCGNTRKKGKLYLCCGTSPSGLPISHFIKDPGVPYPFDYHRAPKLLQHEDGIFHVYMWIGAEFYKSPWFHIEETARLGLSRLVKNNFPIEQLTPGESRIRLIYPYSIPQFDWMNQGEFYENCHLLDSKPCYGEHKLLEGLPKEHEKNYKFCTFAHQDFSGCLANKQQIRYEDEDGFSIFFPTKNNTEFSYGGVVPRISEKTNVSDKKNWQPAILLDLPISHFEFPHYGNEKVEEKLTNQGFNVFITPW